MDSPSRAHRSRVLKLRARGDACFDFSHYLRHNPDLRSAAGGREQLWQHFVEHGQFEDRAFRFTCPARLEWLETPALWARQ